MEESHQEPLPPASFPPDIPPSGEENASNDHSQAGTFRLVLDILETLVLAALLYFGINAVTARIRVDGSSMEPSFHDGEYIVVNRLPVKFNQLKRGDVIVFRFPGDPKEEYIKRIIGLPGDTIRVANQKVYINGNLVEEPYIKAEPIYNGSWNVAANSLFVLGDNRNNSSDSHSWGDVPMSYVIGRAVVIYWPPGEWGFISHPILISP